MDISPTLALNIYLAITIAVFTASRAVANICSGPDRPFYWPLTSATLSTLIAAFQLNLSQSGTLLFLSDSQNPLSENYPIRWAALIAFPLQALCFPGSTAYTHWFSRAKKHTKD